MHLVQQEGAATDRRREGRINMNLELDIGNLVLHGFSASDKDRITRALHRELERLFTEEGMQSSLECKGDIPCIDDVIFEVPLGSSPESIGIHMARSLYEGFNRLG